MKTESVNSLISTLDQISKTSAHLRLSLLSHLSQKGDLCKMMSLPLHDPDLARIISGIAQTLIISVPEGKYGRGALELTNRDAIWLLKSIEGRAGEIVVRLSLL